MHCLHVHFPGSLGTAWMLPEDTDPVFLDGHDFQLSALFQPILTEQVLPSQGLCQDF